ncbi:SGNH/GDSL hydrolase family protein [Pedobacter sp. PLR]|uniref:SGNH/GDSL hydrolase family protein n=1 Tax=Pedobacter sp. PLR TaxID=2994465 RepID=UPI0022463295|nr:SGNH/GDSL hydrolase family protein [Pedobacter sp. PLR]MCX2453963.1 SGNH/GDSL hydrolase family protein [Pedobacter sp. PLR]
MRKVLFCFCSSLLYSIVMGYAQVKPLDDGNYIQQRAGLARAIKVFKQQKTATVAFLGGSITYNPGWRNKVAAELQSRFPATKFHFIAAGIPSLGSLPHAFRFKRDVLDFGKVDLLFLEAAVNDEANGTDSLTQVRSLEGIVRHAKENQPDIDIVMMSFADPDKTKTYSEGKIPVPVNNHELVAGHYGLPSINLAKAVHDRMANQEFSWAQDFKDLHPSPFGQELYFKAIQRLLQDAIKMQTDTDEKPKIFIPAALNQGSFSNGHYIGIENAKISNRWSLQQNWKPEDGKSTRKGFVHIPMLCSTEPGSELSLDFTGNAIGLAVVSGPDAGILTYSIDNGPEKQLDLYTKWSKSLHLPWYLLLDTDLNDGPHQLKLKISASKNESSLGNSCRIAYFLGN